MSKIAVIVCSRIQGNPNHALKGLLYSISRCSANPENVEVFIKYDYNDVYAPETFEEIKKFPYPFKVNQYFGLQERGYIDIHLGYNQLVHFITKGTDIVVAMADDFTVENNWDKALIQAGQEGGEYFIIHQRPHPPITRSNYKTENFNMSYNMFYSENIHIIDEAPAWSMELINAIGFFPVSFTDAWTLCLERLLWMRYDINITKFLDKLYINRKVSEVDQPDNIRWGTQRKENFEYIRSKSFQSIVDQQAKEIHDRLLHHISN